MAVQVTHVATFEEFLDELRRRPAVRLAKLADYGFVASLKTSTGALIMAPQLRVVATAFDKSTDTLLRWDSMRQSDTSATAAFETVRVAHGEVRVVARKEDLRNWLELEGYSVSDGQWTPEGIDRLLNRLGRRQTVP